YEHPTWTGTIFRRGILGKIGNLDLETGSLSDYDFELRAAARCPFVITHDPGALFLNHPSAISSSASLVGTWPGWQKLVRNALESAPLPPDVRDHAKAILDARLVKRLTAVSLGSMVRMHFEDAHAAAGLVSAECGRVWRARLLRSI